MYVWFTVVPFGIAAPEESVQWLSDSQFAP